MYSFQCGVCQKDLICRHLGISDLKQHEKSRGHWSLAQAMQSSGFLDAMRFIPLGSSTDAKATINLNLPLLSACLGVVLVSHWQVKRAQHGCLSTL